MPQLENEQKAGLLLTSIDDDDDEDDDEHLPMTRSIKTKNYHHHDDDDEDQFPIVKKRSRKSSQRPRTNLKHPVSIFIFLLSAFVFGCISGVSIMLYRMSQDAQFGIGESLFIKSDPTIKSKLIQSIRKENFLSWNRTVESEYEIANRLEKTWKSFSTIFNRVNKINFNLTLSKSSSSSQWNGIRIIKVNDDQEINKISAVINDEYLTLSSLIKSGNVDINAIFYLNFGRPEDFSYLIEKNLINGNDNQQTLALMRRKSAVISVTEQVRQAIRYGFSALILFDDEIDENDQIQNDINHRLTLSREWTRVSSKKARQSLLDGINSDDEEEENPICLLIVSSSNVQKMFSSIELDSHQWISPPVHWNDRSTWIKLGGTLKRTTIRFASHLQEIPLQLPSIFGFIQGIVDPDNFILVNYQLNNLQEEKVINEIIQSYGNQMKSGWHPRRSIVFCAWSGLSYDYYPIRYWMKIYSRLFDENLVAVIDLGQGVMGNSTLNLHGSPLFEQIAEIAADTILSPLKHNHTCHKRQGSMMISSEEHHHHSRRHSDDHSDHQQESSECEEHKLYDEWIRASQNRLGKNQKWNLVQMIDIQSAAALFQLQQGIPSLIVEMTDENFISNETFYQKRFITHSDSHLQPEVFVAYTQFLSEIIRQLSDEMIIPFNLTHYADLIDRQAKEYLNQFHQLYQPILSYLNEPNEMITIINRLTMTIRRIQLEVKNISQKRSDIVERFNRKLIQFERLFLLNNAKNPFDQTSKHILFGRAFGLTNTIVPFPSLSNLLFEIDSLYKIELIDAVKLHWTKLCEHLQLIERTLNGFDGLQLDFSN